MSLIETIKMKLGSLAFTAESKRPGILVPRAQKLFGKVFEVGDAAIQAPMGTTEVRLFGQLSQLFPALTKRSLGGTDVDPYQSGVMSATKRSIGDANADKTLNAGGGNMGGMSDSGTISIADY